MNNRQHIALHISLILGIALMVGLNRQTVSLDDRDEKSVELAHQVMEALGGQDAWDNTNIIKWKFFGNRLHIWNKQTGDARIEYSNRSTEHIVILINLNTKEGSAFINGKEVEDEAELKEMLDGGYAAWINDSYWMFMPYKLLDDGVNLEYIGEGETQAGERADIIQLTFGDNTGLTPQNKYLVYVNQDSKLIEQWDFFRDASEDTPDITSAWTNWQQHGNIMLSDDRGEMRGRPIKHADIAVYETLPASVFESSEEVDWSAID